MELNLFGLTGIFGVGKTTASKMFRKNGIPVLNMDSVLRSMFLPGTAVHKELIGVLDNDVINLDGTIDLVKLSAAACLENWIKEYIDELLDGELQDFIWFIKNKFQRYNLTVVGIETNNLLGTKIGEELNQIVMITCQESIRRQRLAAAGFPDSFVDAITEYEKPLKKEMAKGAHYIIDNSGFRDRLELQINDLAQKLLDQKN